MKAHIHSITFDKRKRPKNAVVITPRGIVHVEWMCAAGDWCWFTSGTGDAKKLAVAAIERIERCLGTRPIAKQGIRCRHSGRTSEDGSAPAAIRPMKWVSTYRGYEIRHSTVRDGDGFARYEAEIRVRGEWRFASSEALDDDTVQHDLDAFIDGIEEAVTQLPRQPQAAAQIGDHKW